MKQLVFYVLFWLFTGGVYLRTSAAETGQQTFLNLHTERTVTENEWSRLKDIDVTNPLFILK